MYLLLSLPSKSKYKVIPTKFLLHRINKQSFMTIHIYNSSLLHAKSRFYIFMRKLLILPRE